MFVPAVLAARISSPASYGPPLRATVAEARYAEPESLTVMAGVTATAAPPRMNVAVPPGLESTGAAESS